MKRSDARAKAERYAKRRADCATGDITKFHGLTNAHVRAVYQTEKHLRETYLAGFAAGRKDGRAEAAYSCGHVPTIEEMAAEINKSGLGPDAR